MATEFRHETDADRYTMRVDDQLVSVLDYSINGSAVSFTHTYTAPHQRGHGFAGELVEYAVDDVERNTSLHIVPMCWYVGQWFDEHPDRAALLSR